MPRTKKILEETIENDTINDMEEIVEEVIEDTPALSIEDIEAMLLEQFPPMPTPEPFPGDEDATWVYWSDMDTAERGVPDEWVFERLRNRRDALLAECDWRVVADAPWDVEPWTQYRQALRNLPENTLDPKKAVWPEKPS
jgi:hypothetical protein